MVLWLVCVFWSLLWLVVTQQTFLKYFKCWRFCVCQFDCNYLHLRIQLKVLLCYFFSYQLPSQLQNLNKPQAIPLKRWMVMLTDVKTVNKVVSSVHITSRWTAEVVILTAKIFLTFISSFCDSIYVTDIYSVFHLHLPGYVNQLFSDQLPVGLQAQYWF